uniref:SGNH hydrolase-type esterase domain-containing protein n=1 Tax=Sphaeramia orbicularis TaxID=375764 RepID=A0A672Y8Z7_9TELE
MASLTSSGHCEGCHKLSQQVVILQERISILHQIQDDERLTDSMVVLCPNAKETANFGCSVMPCTPKGAPHQPAPRRPAVLTFTPRPGSPPAVSPASFPPETRNHPVGKPSTCAASSTDMIGPGLSERSAPQDGCPKARPRPAPTTLLIGDSIIRRVKCRSTVTMCFPGATVKDISEKIHDALEVHPSVHTVIVHVGTNDVPRRQSELLKVDFLNLFNILRQARVKSFISGPIPTIGRGYGRFSRLLSLHIWLSSSCLADDMAYIDNFNLFWNRMDSFNKDGLHLNYRGARFLSANINFSLALRQDSRCASPSPTSTSSQSQD